MFASRLLLALGFIATVGAANAQEITLAVNEGTTYQQAGGVHERYAPLLELLSHELKRPVTVKEVDKYAVFDKDLADERYDLAFIHPTQVALKATVQGDYVGLCSAKGYTGYRAHVMVPKDSPLKTLADLKGRKIGVPSMESITTTMFIASLHRMHIDNPDSSFTATRYQDAVPFMVENKFVDAGVTGSAKVADAWAGKGGRILGETKPMPIKLFIASKRLTETERTKVQNLLLGLSNTDAGRAALARIGMAGFVPWDAAVMNDAAQRLGIAK